MLIMLATISNIVNAQNYTAKKAKAGPDVCAIHIGGNHYINMDHIIIYQGTDVCDIKSRNDSMIINLHLFEKNGSPLAVIENSKLVSKTNRVKVTNTISEFSVVSTDTKQVLFVVKKAGYNEKLKRCELKVWVDAFLPNGYYLLCTPEKNSSMSSGFSITGSVFENGGTAISID